MRRNIVDGDLFMNIREAESKDFAFVTKLMQDALHPYYGGDHLAHAKRIFTTHISGGKDQIGHFSFEQKMFILTFDETPIGMIHMVGKRQGTYKISPIIIATDFRGKRGLGTKLLKFAENYAKKNSARQIYCTVARENQEALKFFVRNGYIIAGKSYSHYKVGITEAMLYKLFTEHNYEEKFDRMNISLHLFHSKYERQVQEILLEKLPDDFRGIDSSWVDALFEGYKRRDTKDINVKYKLIFIAIDRKDNVLGVAGATPKKGYPIKIMPFIAKNLPAFVALLTDVPYRLKSYGEKLYIHIIPSVDQTIALQQRGWNLDAVMPGAYHEDKITQQWSLDIRRDDFIRSIRTKKKYLDLIKQGKKTLEVRIGYINIKRIKRGERLVFMSRTDNVITRVRDIREYPDFERMLMKEKPNKIIPGLSKNEVLKTLRNIYPQKLEKYGVVVLELRFEK